MDLMPALPRLPFAATLILLLLPITMLAAAYQHNELSRTDDYPFRPDNEVVYSELELQMEAGFEEGTIRGTARYRFRPKHAHVEKLVWRASGMVIRELLYNGEQVAYQLNDDSLVISFPEAPDKGREHTITVEYTADPVFGVHFRHNGTIFSSALPGSNAHWLPGPIHPWAAMPVVVRLEVPESKTGIASGSLERQSSSDRGRLFVFRTSVEIPITDLFFAVGDFEVKDSFSGTKNLRVYREKGVSSEESLQDMLSFMTRRVREYERLLQRELPFPAFHAVVLSDDFWETRPYYAGAVVVNGNRNHKKGVISRSLAAQWFGIALRPEKWAQSHHITLLQALTAEKLGEEDWVVTDDLVRSDFVVPSVVYDKRNMEHWHWARQFVRNGSEPVLTEAIDASLRTLAARRGVLTESDFSSMMYEITGRWMDIPSLGAPVPEASLRYRVIVEEMRGSDRISLRFVPIEDISDETFTVKVHWNRDGAIRDVPVTFSGRGDETEVSPGGFINNLWIEVPDAEHFRIELEKPFAHWLYQLRRDENAERREEAARALKRHASDPDLQLAVQDVLSREEDPDVLAAMYSLMAELTGGASGTERRFLDGLSSRHKQVRMESMKALGTYRGNSRVESEVFSVIQGSDDIALVNEAIRTYRKLKSADDFRDFAIRFLREDRQDQLFTATLIKELFSIPVDESAVNAVSEYLNSGYSFELRWQAYRHLRKYASDSGWQRDFARNFKDDPDPRIRFITLFSVSRMNFEDRGPFLDSRMLLEYDIRILKKAAELKSAQ
jgi:hypothetical protein